MVSLLLVTYVTIFLTEVVGDKTLYTVSSLSTRFSPLPLFLGIMLAFGGKMLIAVLLGQTIAELPPHLVIVITTATFFLTAFFIWYKRPEEKETEKQEHQSSVKAFLISFSAVFFSEWGDVGQITAAALAARFQAPAIVWLGAIMALATKGVLAMTIGVGLRRRIPQTILRPVTIGLCIMLGITSALKW